MNRETGIDMARGAGILFVISIHAHVAAAWFNSFAVPYFFVLAGYFFSEKTTLKTFIKKKMHSLLLPYIFFLVAAKLFYLLLLLCSGRVAQVKLFSLLDLTDTSDNPPVWFLLALFEVAVGYRCIAAVRNQALQLLLVLLFTGFGFYSAQMNWHLPLYAGAACSMLLFYYAGCQVKRLALLQRLSHSWCLAAIVLLAILFCTGQFFRQGVDIRTNTILGGPMPYLVNSFSGAFFWLLLFSHYPVPPMPAKALAYLGVNSLLICCVHYPLLEIARPLASMLTGHKTAWYAPLVLFICLGLSIVVIETGRKHIKIRYAQLKLQG